MRVSLSLYGTTVLISIALRSASGIMRRSEAAMRRGLFIMWLAALCGLAPGIRAAEVGLIKIDGAISPATGGYIARAINVATARQYACLVIQLDTPGGLLESTKEIVQAFYASPVPTVVYVAPSGAGATSAGCFITLAADVAAMAPNTSIGAAHHNISSITPTSTLRTLLPTYSLPGRLYIRFLA